MVQTSTSCRRRHQELQFRGEYGLLRGDSRSEGGINQRKSKPKLVGEMAMEWHWVPVKRHLPKFWNLAASVGDRTYSLVVWSFLGEMFECAWFSTWIGGGAGEIELSRVEYTGRVRISCFIVSFTFRYLTCWISNLCFLGYAGECDGNVLDHNVQQLFFSTFTSTCRTRT